MTRDEYRAMCIGAMATATARMRGYNLQFMAEWFRNALTMEATAAFYALNGIARVNPIEATEEIINAFIETVGGFEELKHYNIGEIYTAMAAAGDLTNPPEKKPYGENPQVVKDREARL